MGRDRLDRMTLREAESKNPGMDKHRIEKSQKVTIDNLRERREQREVEDLRADVARLARQLELERDKVQLERDHGARARDGADRKLAQKEVANLEKQLKRAHDELASVAEARDAFKKQAATLQADLDQDARLVHLREELKTSKDLATTHAAQLEALKEESEVYQSRCKQLEALQQQHEREQKERADNEDGANSRAQLEEKISQLTRDVKALETAKIEVTNSWETSRATVESLERQVKMFEEANALIADTNKNLADSILNADSSSAGASNLNGTVLNETELGKENKELKAAIATLENRLEAMNKKKGFANSDSAVVKERYRQLIENLGLSEDDVTLLLASGPSWPPIRSVHPDSTVIDHLWMLTDLTAEFEDDRREWDETRAKLEADLGRISALLGQRGDGAGPQLSLSNTNGCDRETDKSKGDFETKIKQKDEAIRQLEQRIEAYEGDATRKSSSDGDRSPAPSTPAGSNSTGFPKPAVNFLINTVTSLNKELATVRDENTSLLLKLAGVE
ncbi:hypothetical protein JCM11491_005625 [Sporobolomyces phaffii]